MDENQHTRTKNESNGQHFPFRQGGKAPLTCVTVRSARTPKHLHDEFWTNRPDTASSSLLENTQTIMDTSGGAVW